MTYLSDTDDFDYEESIFGLPSQDADGYDGDELELTENEFRRGVNEVTLSQRLAHFANTPLVGLITSVESLRQMYGPADPTVADLCEDIQSQLTEFILGLRARPAAFILAVLAADRSAVNVDELAKLVDELRS